jgi:hypothetical protein
MISAADMNAPIPCWHCRYFEAMTYRGIVALCSNPACSRVRSSPEHGCSCWEREPGSDDEPGPPPVAEVKMTLPLESVPHS